MEKIAGRVDVALLEFVAKRPREVTHGHLRSRFVRVGGGVARLLVQNGGRAVLAAEVEQPEVFLQQAPPVLRKIHRLDFDGAVRQEFVEVQATECRGELVLLADRLVEAADLDVAGLLREIVAGDLLAAVDVEQLQERDGERARGAESRAGRNVRDAGETDAVDLVIGQDLPEDPVLDLRGIVHDLCLGIFQDDLIAEEIVVRVQIHILADGSAEDAAAVLFIESGDVASAAAEAHPEGRSGNDHETCASLGSDGDERGWYAFSPQVLIT